MFTPSVAARSTRGFGTLMHAKFNKNRLHTACNIREQRVSLLTAALQNLGSSAEPIRSSALQIEVPSDPLSYTWLTHWKRVEDERRFRVEASIATRARQMERSRTLVDMVNGASLSSFSVPTPSSESRSCFYGGTDRSKSSEDAKGLHDTGDHICSSASSATEELAWLANLPSEADLGPLHDIPSVGFDRGGEARDGTLEKSTADETIQIHYHIPESLQMIIEGKLTTVRPLWVAIHTKREDAGKALLYESVTPIDFNVMKRMNNKIEPFATISNLEFKLYADIREGAWSNFFVGLVGDVGVNEAENLWPNQLLHKDRILYNCRDALDIARFLADPREEDIRLHLENLQKLALDRGYHQGWCWYMLRARWGDAALRNLGFNPKTVLTARDKFIS